jgi:hypothetical protein
VVLAAPTPHTEIDDSLQFRHPKTQRFFLYRCCIDPHKINRSTFIMILPSVSRAVLRQQSKAAARYATTIQTSIAARTMATSSSPWSQFEMAPVDPIVGLNEIYNKDDFPSKVIVGVGAYRDDHGKPYVLPCVREAEQKLMDQNLDMEYTGIVSVFF